MNLEPRAARATTSLPAEHLLLLVADGVRPDVLQEEIDAGQVPAIAALARAGGMHSVSSSFPSVTGPAYVPFIMGRNPAAVGMPGLRWFDRGRTLRWAPGAARSYAGVDIWHADGDVSHDAPTLFELARPSLAGMSMLGRGASVANVGRSLLWSLRGAIAHFRGDMLGWRTIERAATAEFLRRFEHARPRLAVLALTSPDKFAHAYGSGSDAVRGAIRDVDAAIARAQQIARDSDWFDRLRVWIVGDHGHAPVHEHDDLDGWLTSQGHRVLAHPRLGTRDADIALMVGGNAMAHLYLHPAERRRRWWHTHDTQWAQLHERLLMRDAIDLVAVGMDEHTMRVSHSARGSAEVHRTHTTRGERWDYIANGGDPLGFGGTLRGLDHTDAWTAAQSTPYPDSLVQLSSLTASSRAGDLILSAAPGWDLRGRYEPVTHVSTHGALLRDQMMVPLIVDAPPARQPMRTTDVVPSALAALGIATTAQFDGRSFV
ncbi:MAG TPA: alkaline phosphatase family protein [Gemmatimonas sp.]|nr:alkaline phosphatase family protein [Gemmatimonas sp.]